MLRSMLLVLLAMMFTTACNTTKSDGRVENVDSTTAGVAANADEPASADDAATKKPMPGTGVLAGPSVGALTSVTNASGQVAPDFAWTDGRGSYKLSDYRGKVVMINFWGTWCPPCRRELPALIKIREDLPRDKFEIIGINIGERPDGGTIQESVTAFANKNGILYPLVIGDENIVNAYGGVAVVPTTIIVDGNGTMIERIEGSRDEAGFRAAIGKAM